jgi:hypothetical protein
MIALRRGEVAECAKDAMIKVQRGDGEVLLLQFAFLVVRQSSDQPMDANAVAGMRATVTGRVKRSPLGGLARGGL